MTTTSINDGTVCFEIKVPTKSYLMRAASGWTAVDLSGWALVSSGNYLSGYGQIDVYTKVLPTGSNCLNTLSAMYLFDIQFWQDGAQTSIGVDGDYRKKIDTIIAGAVAGITSMLKTVQTVYDNAATAHSAAKSENDKAVASFASSKSNWEAAVTALERAKTSCTAATNTRISDQAGVNSAIADWNSRKSQNEKELEMIAQVQNMVKQMIAIPASSSLEISQHKSGASALANTLLKHPSERMQLVGQSLSLLLQTERSSSEATAVLKVPLPAQFCDIASVLTPCCSFLNHLKPSCVLSKAVPPRLSKHPPTGWPLQLQRPLLRVKPAAFEALKLTMQKRSIPHPKQCWPIRRPPSIDAPLT